MTSSVHRMGQTVPGRKLKLYSLFTGCSKLSTYRCMHSILIDKDWILRTKAKFFFSSALMFKEEELCVGTVYKGPKDRLHQNSSVQVVLDAEHSIIDLFLHPSKGQST